MRDPTSRPAGIRAQALTGEPRAQDALDALEGPRPSAMPARALALAWCLFWILQGTVGVQDFLRRGGVGLWQPLLWEGSSCLVASVIVAAQWRGIVRLDSRLENPWTWFAGALRGLPLAAPVFVGLVYALRHGVYALLGESYRHAGWVSVFAYEMLKFSLFYLLLAAVIYGIRSFSLLADARLRLARERELARQAQLLQLTRQIEPHFLFNALNTIAETIHADPALADALLGRLASLLRAATDLSREAETTLADELRLLEAYGAIMRQRFGARVSLVWSIQDQARDCRVPSLCLQPLLENAFTHGVQSRPGACTIVIGALIEDSRLRLTVSCDAGELTGERREGVGLGNLRERLRVRYGERAVLSLAATAGGGVSAGLDLPCER